MAVPTLNKKNTIQKVFEKNLNKSICIFSRLRDASGQFILNPFATRIFRPFWGPDSLTIRYRSGFVPNRLDPALDRHFDTWSSTARKARLRAQTLPWDKECGRAKNTAVEKSHSIHVTGIHPWRLTWNIIMEVCFRSFSFLNGWFVGSMLIFQGIFSLMKTMKIKQM